MIRPRARWTFASVSLLLVAPLAVHCGQETTNASHPVGGDGVTVNDPPTTGTPRDSGTTSPAPTPSTTSTTPTSTATADAGAPPTTTPPTTTQPTTAPTFATEFTSATGFGTRIGSGAGGTVTFGAASAGAGDNAALQLVLPGNAALGANDHAGPDFASEAVTTKKDFGYGMYRARVDLARCQAGEEVVNGIFTFFNDGTDHNGNGIIDNSEIDIEILCGTPRVLSLSSWTDFEEGNGTPRIVKRTRAVDLGTGKYQESISNTGFDLADAGQDPAFKQPDFPVAGTYYEVGFDWQATSLRYFIVLGGHEVTLWDLKDATVIPKLAGQFLFNVWHSNEHWFDPFGSADYPAQTATMRVDWFKYWAR